MLSKLTDGDYVARVGVLNQLVEDVRERPRTRSDVKYYVDLALSEGWIDKDEAGWYRSALMGRYHIR